MTLTELIQLCTDRAADTVMASAVVATVLGGLRRIGAVPGDDTTPPVKGWLDVTRLQPRLQPLVPMALTAGALLWLARDAGLSWGMSGVVAFVNGVLGGFVASGVAHDTPRILLGRSTVRRSNLARTAAVALFFALLSGCAGSFEEARMAGLQARSPTRVAAVAPSERCQSLDNQHRTWGGVAKISAVLAGAQGLSTIPVDDKTARIGLAAGTAVAAAAAAGAEYLSEGAGESWARECSTGAP